MQHPDSLPRRHLHLGLVGGFALALGVIVAAALSTCWFFLADYQDSRPKNLADQIFSAYVSGDAKTIQKYSDNLPEVLESPVLFANYYAENTDLGSLYFYPGATDNPLELRYEFVSGADLISTLTLRQTGRSSRFGFPQYEIESLTGHPLTRYKIVAPSDTVLLVNGKPLDEAYRTDEQSSIDNFSTLTNTIFRTKAYEITDFFYIDELSASSKDGCSCTVFWSTDHRTATIEKQMSEAQRAQISDFATEFSKVYSVFATKRYGPRAPVLQLLQPDTPFYGALHLYSNDWGEFYAGDRYENRVIDRLMQYSPTEFSCDIRFNYVIQLRDGLEKSYPYSMTYYLTNRSGRLLLVDMQVKV